MATRNAVARSASGMPVCERSLQPAGKSGGGAIEIEERAEDGHADGAQWNQAVFDFSAGEIACGDAAKADADADGGLQIADVRIVDAQNVVAIDRRW